MKDHLDTEYLERKLASGVNEIGIYYYVNQWVSFCNYTHPIMIKELGNLLDSRMKKFKITKETLKDHWIKCTMNTIRDTRPQSRNYGIGEEDIHSTELLAQVQEESDNHGVFIGVEYYNE